MMSIVSFALPAFLWRAVHDTYSRPFSGAEVMRGFEVLGPALVVVAIFCGILLVAQPWAVDSNTRHVYALSLPIPWSQYVSMRFGAGAILLLVPTIALWLGTLFVLTLVQIPPSLHAYPGTLALRFLLGALVAYSLTFAIQYVSGKKAAHLLLGLALGLAAIFFLAEIAGAERITATVLKFLVRWPGPLAVFSDPWMLIDV
jgi:hypothetical protein